MDSKKINQRKAGFSPAKQEFLMNKIVGVLGVLAGLCGLHLHADAQPYVAMNQGASPGITANMKRVEDRVKEEFAKIGLNWPVKEVYLRSFKYDGQLELWARNSDTMPFQLFKKYKVCAMAGAMGPKRIEGDFQVPEGFYRITEFNPRSQYHLSLKLNYPNESDRMLSDQVSPGGHIYIHGSCVTVGCIPLRDEQIEEVFLIASAAKSSGQDYIPVHIFPVDFNNKKSMTYLYKTTVQDPVLQHFEIGLKEAYDYFNQNRQLPLIGINTKGDYAILN